MRSRRETCMYVYTNMFNQDNQKKRGLGKRKKGTDLKTQIRRSDIIGITAKVLVDLILVLAPTYLQKVNFPFESFPYCNTGIVKIK